MGEVPINQISSNVLGFEITHFSNINRVLNTLERDNLLDHDIIHYLRILIKSMNENDVAFNTLKNQSKSMKRLMNIFIPLAKRLGKNSEYKSGLLKIYDGIEVYLKDTDLNSFRSNARDTIARILNTESQPRYASVGNKIEGRRILV